MGSPPQAAAPTAQETLERLCRAGGGRVHLSGIGGVGMAGLAVLLQARGLRVSGCDAALSPLTEALRARGIDVEEGQSPAHVTGGADWLVRSAAVAVDNAEVAAAVGAGIPVHRRGEVLPLFAAGPGSVTVSGTHGKTTTATVLTQILRAAGLDPTFCIGGESSALGGPAQAGRDPYVVVEADESDGTAALYRPAVAIVTNIEFDHMEHFSGVEAFEACFATLMAGAGRVVYGADDPRAARLGGACRRALSFGLRADAGVRAADLDLTARGARFTLWHDGASLGAIALPLPGRHNVLNALAAAAAALALGIRPDAICRGLESAVLPRRRFEVVVDHDEVRVISDYAHHPSEVAACVAAARGLRPPRIMAVFQPHRYTRTRALGDDFPAAFAGVDELALTPVYAASEAPLEGGTTWDLYARMRAAGVPSAVWAASSLEAAWEALRRRLRRGDLLLVIGAGSVEGIAAWARDALGKGAPETLHPGRAWMQAARALPLAATRLAADEPLARHTTLGVGGVADVWAEVGSLDDLRALLCWVVEAGVPWRVLGGGSNTLAPDAGAPGLTVHLSGPAFAAVTWGDAAVVAGAAVPLAALVAEAVRRGRGGIEALHGIPGTLGGAVRGNAGAGGRCVADVLTEVTTLEPDGAERVWPRAALAYAYRTCPSLSGRIVLQATLCLPPAEPAALRAAVAQQAERRAWMRGLRSAGSVFRNPPGDVAGRLLDLCGFKGRAVGGARFTERHANVMATEPGATASDVRALIELSRDAVRRRHGIVLEPELAWLDA